MLGKKKKNDHRLNYIKLRLTHSNRWQNPTTTQTLTPSVVPLFHHELI